MRCARSSGGRAVARCSAGSASCTGCTSGSAAGGWTGRRERPPARGRRASRGSPRDDDTAGCGAGDQVRVGTRCKARRTVCVPRGTVVRSSGRSWGSSCGELGRRESGWEWEGGRRQPCQRRFWDLLRGSSRQHCSCDIWRGSSRQHCSCGLWRGNTRQRIGRGTPDSDSLPKREGNRPKRGLPHVPSTASL